MKRLKVLLMTTILAVALCACGGKNDSQGGNSDEKSASSGAKKESFECQPEMLDAEPEDTLIQIDDVVIKRDGSMLLNDVVSAFMDSDKGFTFMDLTGSVEFNFEQMVPSRGMVTITVCKDNQAYVRLYGMNNTDSTIKASDSQMILHDAGLGLPLEMFSHVYYCKGVRGDGEGLTYDSVKELFPADIYNVRESNDSSGKSVIVYSVSFTGGASSLDFYINIEDGTCFRVMEKSLY